MVVAVRDVVKSLLLGRNDDCEEEDDTKDVTVGIENITCTDLNTRMKVITIALLFII